ncbi:MAG TPA: hypothetical protein VIZ68_04965, partial [Thermoplasmata archaeon]
GVFLGGAVNRSSSSSLGFSVPNGSYTFVVETLSGYSAAPSAGGLLVAGSGARVSVAFTAIPPPPPNATVSFVETGLPPLAAWQVGVNGAIRSSTDASMSFSLPPGSYFFIVYSVLGYLPFPTSFGTFTIGRSNLTIHVSFIPEFVLTFEESGLPMGTNWSVTLDGRVDGSTSGTIPVVVGEGIHTYSVGTVAGFDSSPAGGSLNVSANASVAVYFVLTTPPTFPVMFTEAGLPAGTPWCVSIDLKDLCSTGVSAKLLLANGSFPFDVRQVPDYTSVPPSGTVTIAGVEVDRTITYSFNPPAPATTTPAGVATTTLEILGAGAAIVGALVGIVVGVLAARRRPPVG